MELTPLKSENEGVYESSVFLSSIDSNPWITKVEDNKKSEEIYSNRSSEIKTPPFTKKPFLYSKSVMVNFISWLGLNEEEEDDKGEQWKDLVRRRRSRNMIVGQYKDGGEDENYSFPSTPKSNPHIIDPLDRSGYNRQISKISTVSRRSTRVINPTRLKSKESVLRMAYNGFRTAMTPQIMRDNLHPLHPRSITLHQLKMEKQNKASYNNNNSNDTLNNPHNNNNLDDDKPEDTVFFDTPTPTAVFPKIFITNNINSHTHKNGNTNNSDNKKGHKNADNNQNNNSNSLYFNFSNNNNNQRHHSSINPHNLPPLLELSPGKDDDEEVFLKDDKGESVENGKRKSLIERRRNRNHGNNSSGVGSDGALEFHFSNKLSHSVKSEPVKKIVNVDVGDDDEVFKSNYDSRIDEDVDREQRTNINVDSRDCEDRNSKYGGSQLPPLEFNEPIITTTVNHPTERSVEDNYAYFCDDYTFATNSSTSNTTFTTSNTNLITTCTNTTTGTTHTGTNITTTNNNVTGTNVGENSENTSFYDKSDQGNYRPDHGNYRPDQGNYRPDHGNYRPDERNDRPDDSVFHPNATLLQHDTQNSFFQPMTKLSTEQLREILQQNQTSNEPVKRHILTNKHTYADVPNGYPSDRHEHRHKKKHTGRQIGKGFGQYLTELHYRKSRIDSTVRTKINSLPDHRPYFTFWCTFVQIVCYIIAICVHDLAPFGLSYSSITEEVLKPNLAIEESSYVEENNVWIGLRQADLIHMGARYSGCMRRDELVQREVERVRKRERNTGCCIRLDGSGCYQASEEECLYPLGVHLHKSSLTRWKTWSNQSGPFNRSSGAVCHQDPRFCMTPVLAPNIRQHEWPDDITRWPACKQPYKVQDLPADSDLEHLTCEMTGRPCCVGVRGWCVITTRDDCNFMRGYYHDDETLCSQVDCMEDICGMIPFLNHKVPDQIYRLVSSLFIHAGVLHLLVTVVFQFTVMRDLEKLAGWLRISIIYILSGVGGSLFAGILLPHLIEAGPSGSQFGLLSCLFVEVIQNWYILRKPKLALLRLCLLLLFLLSLGLMPMVDNLAHMGGFLMGFMLSFIFLPYINYTVKDCKRKLTVVVVCAVLSSVFLVGLMVMFYLPPFFECTFCHYLNCIPITPTLCSNLAITRHGHF